MPGLGINSVVKPASKAKIRALGICLDSSPVFLLFQLTSLLNLALKSSYCSSELPLLLVFLTVFLRISLVLLLFPLKNGSENEGLKDF